jgi:hypothetical protein
VAGGAEEQLLDTLLVLCREQKLLNARGRQRTDSTHVLGAVRFLNRLECVLETLRAAPNALASAAPEWLRAAADPAWPTMLRPQELRRRFRYSGGLTRRGSRPPCCWSPRPMIRRCTTPGSNLRSGSVTRYI